MPRYRIQGRLLKLSGDELIVDVRHIEPVDLGFISLRGTSLAAEPDSWANLAYAGPAVDELRTDGKLRRIKPDGEIDGRIRAGKPSRELLDFVHSFPRSVTDEQVWRSAQAKFPRRGVRLSSVRKWRMKPGP
ncbi:MAG TPA: hypothetical protein VEY12_04945 [Thermoplasmata archaeon]|nr:hypothetical protein [Thermoplasmata archaeon]